MPPPTCNDVSDPRTPRSTSGGAATAGVGGGTTTGAGGGVSTGAGTGRGSGATTGVAVATIGGAVAGERSRGLRRPPPTGSRSTRVGALRTIGATVGWGDSRSAIVSGVGWPDGGVSAGTLDVGGAALDTDSTAAARSRGERNTTAMVSATATAPMGAMRVQRTVRVAGESAALAGVGACTAATPPGAVTLVSVSASPECMGCGESADGRG